MLTAREREILQLLADGMSNADVAARLFISQETVKSHVRHILTKLEADTRTHAVATRFARRSSIKRSAGLLIGRRGGGAPRACRARHGLDVAGGRRTCGRDRPRGGARAAPPAQRARAARGRRSRARSPFDQLITAEQEERRRLALFLHDVPVQAMSGIALMLDGVMDAIEQGAEDDAKRVLKMALDRQRETIRELRDLSFALEPVVLRDQGFAPAVQALADQIGTFNKSRSSSTSPPARRSPSGRRSRSTRSSARRSTRRCGAGRPRGSASGSRRSTAAASRR